MSCRNRFGNFRRDAAIDEFLLDPAKLGEFAQNRLAAYSYDQIRNLSDGWIRGYTGKAVRAAALEPHGKVSQWRRRAPAHVDFDQPQKSLSNRFREHREFFAAALLFEDVKRLGEIGVPFSDFIAQHRHLGILAAQAEHRGAGNVRMMNVAGDQGAKIVGVFARAAAAAFMKQELDSVHVGKKRGPSGHFGFAAAW